MASIDFPVPGVSGPSAFRACHHPPSPVPKLFLWIFNVVSALDNQVFDSFATDSLMRSINPSGPPVNRRVVAVAIVRSLRSICPNSTGQALT
jgi:hypothetical protein